MDAELLSLVKNIREDIDHGASYLSREAVATLGFVAQTSKAKNQQQLLNEFTETANLLIDARPSMMAIQNMVQALSQKVYQKAEIDITLDELKSSISSMSKQSIEDSLIASERVSRLASQLVEDNDIVMSCSYSATIIQALKLAKISGRCFSVVLAESHTRNGSNYGGVTAKELDSLGIACQVIADTYIQYHILQSSKIIVGIDTIIANGSIVNGKPSYVLATEAKQAGIPFIAIGEASKLDRHGYFNRQSNLEVGFEVIPAELITAIITEQGRVSPERIDEVCEILDRIL
ncbi:MAG: hypothetical protein SVY53_09340 [Chloroflexota bacterium]|nr:hypothetical protein [Chloroflexota bacterium]